MLAGTILRCSDEGAIKVIETFMDREKKKIYLS